jgi:hypothetical protein
MTILLVLLTLLIILFFLFHFTTSVKEGFQVPVASVVANPLSPSTVQAYTQFLNFYNPFCANWQKAVQTSTAATIPQEAATDPTQIQGPQAPQISDAEMNSQIANLSQQLGRPLPNLCQALPPQIDSTTIQQIIPMIPTDAAPYQNALDWMNTNLSQAHANLGAALQGASIKETFTTDPTCNDITQCIANNPQLAQQLTQQISEQQQQQQQQSQQQLEQQLITLLNPFITNQSLINQMQQNQDLMQKSEEIQKQAQSGELINQINIPGVTGVPAKKYDLPAGSSALQQMQQTDPDKYNQLKNNYSMWFGLKQIMEQINGAL